MYVVKNAENDGEVRIWRSDFGLSLEFIPIRSPSPIQDGFP